MSRRFDVRDAAVRPRAVAAAATAAKRGRMVLLPTESVYALLADAFSARGVGAVRAAKQRPDTSALPVAVSSVRMLRGIAERLPGEGQTLVDAFWPGPLTLVLEVPGGAASSSAGTEGFRVPDCRVTLALLRAVERARLDTLQVPAARRILRAAAWTYVAASLASLLNFWRWMAVLRR